MTPQVKNMYMSDTQFGLSVIDSSTYSIVASNAQTGDGVAYNPMSQEMYLADPAGKTITIFNAATNTYVSTISSVPQCTTGFTVGPEGLSTIL